MPPSSEQKVISELQTLCSDDDSPWQVNFNAILNALAILESLQPRFSLVDSSRPWSQKASRLVNWLSSDPAFSSFAGGLDIVDDLSPEKGHRGVRTRSKVEKGQVLMRVPLTCMMTTETAIESHELGPLIEQPALSFLNQVPLVLLGLHLLIEHAKCLETEAEETANALADPKTGNDSALFLEIPRSAAILDGRTADEILAHKAHIYSEKAKLSRPQQMPLQPTTLDAKLHPWGSRFRAFIACLPESTAIIKNCPSWLMADYHLLGDSSLGQNAAKYTRDLVRGYIKVYSMFSEHRSVRGLERHVTWAHWKWVFCVILSRKNLMPGRSGSLHQTLCPLYDMVNHEPGEITAFFSNEHGGIELSAPRDFSAGDEILMSYGDRSASDLTMLQGFFVDGEGAVDNATVKLSIKTAAEDPLAPIRIKMLQNLKICAIAPGDSIRLLCIRRKTVDEADGGTSTGTSLLVLPSIFCTFCRIAALDKPSLTQALRLVQSALALCGHSSCTDPPGKHSHGHSHGHNHSHSHGGDACSHSDGGGGGGEDNQPIALPLVNEENEKAAISLAELWLKQSLERILPEPELHGLAATPQTKVLMAYLRGQQALLKEALRDVKALWENSLQNS